MARPCRIVEQIEAHLCRRAIIVEPYLRLREIGGAVAIVESVAQFQNNGISAIAGGLRSSGHAAIWGRASQGRNHGRLRKPILVVE
jgi:hypothetical protein